MLVLFDLTRLIFLFRLNILVLIIVEHVLVSKFGVDLNGRHSLSFLFITLYLLLLLLIGKSVLELS